MMASGDNQPLLQVDSVSKIYQNGSAALAQTSMRLAEGERLALLGRSGCGKSTLLRLIAGLEQVTSGRILFRGDVVNGVSLDIGLAFQEPRLLPWLNVADNISLARYDSRGDEIKNRVPELLQLVSLNGCEKMLPRELSGGMAQRVALARTLAMRPALMMLDEPMGALDIESRLILQDRLDSMWRADATTVIIVTHDLDEAVRLADRFIIMKPDGAGVKAELANYPGDRSHRDSDAFDGIRAELRHLINKGDVCNGS